MSSNHIINKKIFDVAYSNEKKAHQLQNRISDLAKIRLTQTVHDLLDKYDNPDITLYLDQIELDLGNVSEEDLERQIIEKTKVTLDKILSDRIKAIKNGKGDPADSYRTIETKYIELLKWFLSKGTLPWWYTEIKSVTIPQLIDHLMATERQKVVHLIQENANSIHFIQRLVRNFSEQYLELIVRDLRPNEAEQIIDTKKNLNQINARSPLAGSSQSHFKYKLWEFVFEYLLNNRGSLFNTKNFVHSLLNNLAHHFNTAFNTFIALINTAVLQIKNELHLPTELVSILRDIHEETVVVDEKKAHEKAQFTPLSSSDYNWLLNATKNNLSNLSALEHERFITLIKTKSFEQHHALMDLIQRYLQSEQGKHLVDQLDLKPLKQLKKSKKQNKTESKLKEFIFEYLLTGSFKQSRFTITKLAFRENVLALIASNSALFYKFLQKEGQKADVQKRLLLHLVEANKIKLVQFIEPTGAPIIIQFSKKMDTLIRYPHLKLKTTQAQLRLLKWEFILSALLVDRGSHFNLKTFVKATLSNLSNHFSIDYKALILYVLNGLDTQESSSLTGLSAVLKELQTEEIKIIEKESQTHSKAKLKEVQFNWVAYLFSHAEEPWWADKNELKLADLETIIIGLEKPYKSELKKIFLTHLQKSNVRLFIIDHLKETGVLQIIKSLAPERLGQIKFYATVLDQLQQADTYTKQSEPFQLQKWDVILFELIADKGSLFNYKSFMIRTLHKLAHHFNVTFEQLFTQLIFLADNFKSTANSDFSTTLSALKKEYKTAIKSKKKKTLKKEVNNEAWEKIKNETAEKYRPLFELLLFFKKNIHWSFTRKKELKNWFNSAEKIHPLLLRKLFEHARFNFQDIFLLFRQFEPKNQQFWIRTLMEEDTLFMRYYLNDIEKLIAVIQTIPLSKSQQLIQAYSLAYMMGEKQPNKHTYFKYIYQFLIQNWGIPHVKAEKKLKLALKELRPAFTSTLPLSYAKMVSQQTEEKENQINKKTTLGNDVKEAEKIATEGTPYPKKDEEEILDGETFHISNAGLVIIWPFLIRYFDMLQLTENEKFKSEETKLKAIHALQFLVTGEENHLEHDLYLNKLICGVNGSEPIDNELALTNNEKEVSESLLLGVIGNWPIIKDTSVAGLRETFLQRDGSIRYREDAIELRVENKTLDILLDSLPWGYSMVKLPWMKLPIHVIWR